MHMKGLRPLPVVTPNSILAALLAREYKHLEPCLERVALKRGQVIYRADQTALPKLLSS